MQNISTNIRLLLILTGTSLIYWVLVFSTQVFYLDDKLFVVLGDDAMISMRYAKHWADGFGIYWNKSGSPEGYTNFLLTSIMAFVHLFNPGIETASLYILIFNWIIHLLVVWVSYEVASKIFKNVQNALVTSFLIGFSFQFLVWGKWGFETSMLSLFAISAIYFVLNKQFIKASLIMALGVLTRDDFSILVFVLGTVFPLIGVKAKERRGEERRGEEKRSIYNFP